MRNQATTLVLGAALLLSACGTVEDDTSLATSRATSRPSGRADGSRDVLTSAPAGGETRLGIWGDPEFQRHFAQSYIAESDVEPSLTADERERMLEVIPLITADQMDQAAAKLEVLATDAASAVFDFTLGNVYLEREQVDLAAQRYRIATTKYPKFLRAWRLLGEIHVRQGDFEKAITPLTKVIELGGGDGFTYGLLGVAYASRGEHLSAESAFRMATLLHPETVDWKMGLAESFFRQGRFADAAALLDTLIAADPDRADLWLAQGEAYARMNRPLEAAENFELVDELGGSTVDSLYNLADIYANEQIFDLAVSSYIRAMERNPDAPADRAVRAAKFLSANGALADTRALIEGIESLRGESLGADERKDLLKLRARIAVAEGAGEEEARVLEEIIALDPLDGDALVLLGRHAARADDAERAIFYYERAASLEAFEADAKVYHAQVLVGQGRYDDALRLLTRAQAIRPRDNIQDYLERVQRAAQAKK